QDRLGERHADVVPDRGRGEAFGEPARDARDEQRGTRVIELVEHADLPEHLPGEDEGGEHGDLQQADEPRPSRERQRGDRRRVGAHPASRLRAYERWTSSRRSAQARSYSALNSGAKRISVTLRGRGRSTG